MSGFRYDVAVIGAGIRREGGVVSWTVIEKRPLQYLASFLILGLSTARSAVHASAGLFAITAWSVPALMAASSGDVFGARLAPAALGLMTIIMGVGQALGPYLAGRIADAARGAPMV